MYTLDKWKEKVVVVTGASSGIGAAIVGKLVEEGLQVRFQIYFHNYRFDVCNKSLKFFQVCLA